MNNEQDKAHLHALIAMYVMSGYEATERERGPSVLQNLHGHTAVARKIGEIAAAVSDPLADPGVPNLREDDVLEHAIMRGVFRPFGRWLYENSMSTTEAAVEHLRRSMVAWLLSDDPAPNDEQIQAIAAEVFDTRSAYLDALHRLEEAVAGALGSWTADQRADIEENVDALIPVRRINLVAAQTALVGRASEFNW